MVVAVEMDLLVWSLRIEDEINQLTQGQSTIKLLYGCLTSDADTGCICYCVQCQ